MKLHAGDYSTFGRQVRIMLAEKQLPFERDATPTAKRDAAAFARLNPGLKVPVLVDGGRVLFDTRVILEYLLAAYPGTPPGAPPPPLSEGLTRPDHHLDDSLVLATLHTLLDSAVNLRRLQLDGITPAQAPYLGRQQERMEYCLDWLEERVTPEGFVPGRFSVADIAWITALDFCEDEQLFVLGAREKLRAAHRYFADRPSVAAVRAGQH